MNNKIRVEELKDQGISKIIYYETIESTNKIAKERAKKGAPDGTIIIAEEQTAGKGRLGREWYSPKGRGLWFSLVVRPNILPTEVHYLTIISSLAILKAIRGLGLEADIKWPNDIIIKGKKVCGILSELDSKNEMVNFAIIGIGINVNQEYFPQHLNKKATSLKIELGKEIDRILLLKDIIVNINKYKQLLLKKETDYLLSLWKERLTVIGEEVIVYDGKASIKGRVIDVASRGELVLKDNSGEVHTFWAGDVSLRKENYI